MITLCSLIVYQTIVTTLHHVAHRIRRGHHFARHTGRILHHAFKTAWSRGNATMLVCKVVPGLMVGGGLLTGLPNNALPVIEGGIIRSGSGPGGAPLPFLGRTMPSEMLGTLLSNSPPLGTFAQGGAPSLPATFPVVPEQQPLQRIASPPTPFASPPTPFASSVPPVETSPQSPELTPLTTLVVGDTPPQPVAADTFPFVSEGAPPPLDVSSLPPIPSPETAANEPPSGLILLAGAASLLLFRSALPMCGRFVADRSAAIRPG
jgi:hypothetical protein